MTEPPFLHLTLECGKFKDGIQLNHWQAETFETKTKENLEEVLKGYLTSWMKEVRKEVKGYAKVREERP